MKHFVCLSFLSFLMACSDSQPKDKESKKSQLPVPEFIFKDLEQESEACTNSPDQCLTIWMQYPFFVQQKGVNAQYLNNQVINLLLTDSTEGINSPEELANWYQQEHKQALSAPPYTAEWQINKEITPTFIHPLLVSLKLETFEFTGGAHGSGLVRYLNLLVQNQKTLQLSDFLLPGYQNQLNQLAEAAFRKSRELQFDTDLSAEGFDFGEQGFEINDNFGFTPEGIEFVFNAYEVAPYAMGSSSFTITWEELLKEKLLKREWEDMIKKELEEYNLQPTSMLPAGKFS